MGEECSILGFRTGSNSTLPTGVKYWLNVSRLTKRRLILAGLGALVALALLSPLLFLGYQMANKVVGASLSPTRDAAAVQPSPVALAGTYVSTSATITMQADGTFTVADLPSYDSVGQRLSCDWTGTGHWDLRGNDLSLQMSHSVYRAGKAICSGRIINTGFFVLGQQPPYKLYMPIGDPDRDDGLTFEKTKE